MKVTSKLKFFVFILGLPQFSNAQNITLSGSLPAVVNEAGDYFTDVLGKPRNFETTCDGGQTYYSASSFSSNGDILTSVHGTNDGQKLELLRVPTVGTNLNIQTECGDLRAYQNLPVDADKYTGFATRMANSSPSQYTLLFTKEQNYLVNSVNWQFDGLRLPFGDFQTTSNTFGIKDLNLQALSTVTYPWSGLVKGIALWPSVYEPAGGQLQIDWARLYDRSSAPSAAISWNNSGVSSASKVALFVDKNNSGYDGEIYRSNLDLNSNLALDFGALPPGTYFIYAQVQSPNGTGGFFVTAQSNYLGPIRIDGKPFANITSPSWTSGREYARDEMNDPWDMNQATDLVDLFNPDGSWAPLVYHGLQAANFSNGKFYGASKEIPVKEIVDPQVHFKVTKPINTNLYRYFCVDMQIDPSELSRTMDHRQLYNAGWVARVIGANNATPGNYFTSFAAMWQEKTAGSYPDLVNGFSQMCFDLFNSQETAISNSTWQAKRSVKTLRFDPFEKESYDSDLKGISDTRTTKPATGFIIDSAALYAENYDSVDRKFNIQYDVKDPENQAMSVSLYYDLDNKDFNGTLINTTSGITNGAQNYSWDTSNVPKGEYFIYLLVTDIRGNSNKYYSSVNVKIKQTEALRPSKSMPCDFDGDGSSDLTVKRGRPGQQGVGYSRNSSDGVIKNRAFGILPPVNFFDRDGDGDLFADWGFNTNIVETTGRDFRTQSSDSKTPVVNFGGLDEIPIENFDYDGDGIDDRALFKNGYFSIQQSSNNQIIGVNWGTTGDLPVSGDYDGDGKSDIAVFRPSEGNWYIIQSSTGLALVRQFGLPTDQVVPGDYDGDGKTDLAVFRPGSWFICNSSTGFDCSAAVVYNIGAAGGYAVKGNFDGDNRFDPAVFNEGRWEIQLSMTNTLSIQNFGLSGDNPVCVSSSGIELLKNKQKNEAGIPISNPGAGRGTDTQAPVITSAKASSISIRKNQSVSFTVKAIDNVGVYRVWVDLGGGKTTILSLKNGEYRASIRFNKSGTYNPVFFANDKVGNLVSVAIASIKVR